MSSEQMPDDGPLDDIELAYREALKAIDDAEQQVGSALMEMSEDSAEEGAIDPGYVSIGEELAEDLAAENLAAENLTAEDGVVENPSAEKLSAATALTETAFTRVSPREVVEAALFVGGEVSLTAKRLAAQIGHGTDARVAVKIIDELNEQYSQQNRPYEIRLREGGFQLELREEFHQLQLQMFGLGPREVKLSPEALEILAFVAYNQPITREDLVSTGRHSPMTPIRQLIRLQLVAVERTGKRRTDVAYRTTERFLEVFNLQDLSDLPQADVFSFK